MINMHDDTMLCLVLFRPEHCGFEYDYTRTLPSQDFMLQFLRVYCAAVLPPNSELTEAFLLGFLVCTTAGVDD